MITTAEYDAFSPWIYEVRSPEEVRSLFRSHHLDLETVRLTIKDPRTRDRRDANSSMALYDSLLSLGPDALTVLTRRGRDLVVRELAHDEIQGMTDVVDLLGGHLTLHADGSPVEVRLNGSPSEIVAHLVKVLRGLYAGAPAGAVVPAGPSPAGRHRSVSRAPDVEREMQNLYHRLSAEGDARIVEIQKKPVMAPADANAVRRAIARAWPTTPQSTVVMLDPRELQVLHQGRAFVTVFKPVHALGRTLIPMERVGAVDIRPGRPSRGRDRRRRPRRTDGALGGPGRRRRRDPGLGTPRRDGPVARRPGTGWFRSTSTHLR